MVTQRYQVDIDIWASALASSSAWDVATSGRSIFYSDLTRTVSAYTDSTMVTPVTLYDVDGNVLTQPVAVSTVTGKQVWIDYGKRAYFVLSSGQTFEVTAPNVPLPLYTPSQFGAKADTLSYTDGVINGSGTQLTSSAATFTSSVTGKLLNAYEGGVSNSVGVTMTYVSAHTVSLSPALDASFWGDSSVGFSYGTDNVVAGNAAMAAASAAGGIFTETVPGRYGFGYGGASGPGSTDGYCLRILNNVRIWMPGVGVEFISLYEGKNIYYGYQNHDFSIEGAYANCLSNNIAPYKLVECYNFRMVNCGGVDGRICHDFICCYDFQFDMLWGTTTALAETTNSDRRGLSVADRSTSAGVSERFQGGTCSYYGYFTGCRLVTDAGVHKVQFGTIDSLILRGCFFGLTFENGDTSGTVLVEVGKVFVDTPTGVGLYFLRANDCKVGSAHIKDPTQGAVMFFGASRNQIGRLEVDGQKASYSGVEMHDQDGVGSTYNSIAQYIDKNASAGDYSLELSIDALSGFNSVTGYWTKGQTAKATDRLRGTVNKDSESATAPDILDNATISAQADIDVIRLTPAAARTGIIMASGTVQGEVRRVRNESANSLTFAAVGTSHVQGGAATTIPANTEKAHRWTGTVWYQL